MKRKLLILAIFMIPSVSFAEPLTLTQAVATAQSKSPDIQQLEEQYLSASAKKRLALAPTEPTFSITENDLSQRFKLGTEASEVYQLTQPIGFPGRAWLNRSQLGDQAESIRFQMEALKLQIAVNVKTAYYNLQLAQKNIDLNNDTRLAYERILAIAKRRYETAASSQVDYLNAQVALLSNQNDLRDLETAEKAARAQLNVFLHNPVDASVSVEPIRMVYHPNVDLGDAVTKMLENRNEIKSAVAQRSASDTAYRLAWMQLVPDFQLSLGMNNYRVNSASPYSSTPEATNTGIFPTHTYSIGLSFTVPLWFLFNEREVIVGASHDRAAAEANVDMVYNQSKTALETAVDTILSTEQKIENFEKHILPLSEQSLNLAMIDYSSGKIDFQALSDTATARRQARLTYVQAIVTYLTNYATYGQLIGQDL